MKKIFLALIIVATLTISFCQQTPPTTQPGLKVELIEPKNGLYTNPGYIVFSFTTTNTTELEELERKGIDPNNLTCYLVLQVQNRYLKQGPLNLPIGREGEFEYLSFPPNNYIWSVQCNGIPSEYRLLIVQNKSFEEFVNELKNQNQTNNNSKATITETEKKQNQTLNENKISSNEFEVNFYYVIIFLVVLLGGIIIYYKKFLKAK